MASVLSIHDIVLAYSVAGQVLLYTVTFNIQIGKINTMYYRCTIVWIEPRCHTPGPLMIAMHVATA